MKNLSVRWQKLIVWLTGYLNIIAFVIAGGYIHQTTQDEEVKRSAKTALILTALFTGIEIIRMLVQYFISLSGTYEGLQTLTNISYIVGIVKILCFIVLFVLDMLGVGFIAGKKPVAKEEQKEE